MNSRTILINLSEIISLTASIMRQQAGLTILVLWVFTFSSVTVTGQRVKSKYIGEELFNVASVSVDANKAELILSGVEGTLFWNLDDESTVYIEACSCVRPHSQYIMRARNVHSREDVDGNLHQYLSDGSVIVRNESFDSIGEYRIISDQPLTIESIREELGFLIVRTDEIEYILHAHDNRIAYSQIQLPGFRQIHTNILEDETLLVTYVNDDDYIFQHRRLDAELISETKLRHEGRHINSGFLGEGGFFYILGSEYSLNQFGTQETSGFVAKYAVDGTMLWQHIFDAPKLSSRFERGFINLYKLIILGDESIIVAGEIGKTSIWPTTDLFVARLSASGGLLWKLTEPITSGSLQMYHMQETADDEIRIIGDDGGSDFESQQQPFVIFLDDIHSVQEFPTRSRPIRIFNNPTYYLLHFEVPEEIEIISTSIFSLNGQSMWYQSGSNIRVLPTWDLIPGMYILSVETLQGTFGETFLKR